MKRVLSAIAGVALLAVSAEAQSYRCEHGELVGGDPDVPAKCTVNSAGQITSVTPYKNSNLTTVKIYRSGQPANATVQTYNPSNKRAYRPAPLTPQASPTTRTYTVRQSVRASAPPAYPPGHVGAISPNGNVYTAQRSNIITAAPTPAIQRAAYAAPCTFKIREVPARGKFNTYEVCSSDIRSNDRKSMRKLYARIKRASRRACATDYDSVLTRWSRANSNCVESQIDRAVMTSGMDPLRAYHLAKTGRGVPTVEVGPLRDAY